MRSTCPPTLSLPIGNDRRCPPVLRVHGDPRRSPLLLPRAFVFFVHLSPSSLASDLRGLQSAQSRRSAQSADRRAASLRLAAVPALVVSLCHSRSLAPWLRVLSSASAPGVLLFRGTSIY